MNRQSKRKQSLYTATEEGIIRAEKALQRLGYGSISKFSEVSYVSRSTITKFFQRKPIKLDCFQQICQELKLLDWKEIAGIKEESKLRSFQQETEEMTTVEQECGGRKVTVIDPITETVKVEITLKGDINDISNQKIILEIIKEYSGNTIRIEDVKRGSIKLILNGSPEDIEKLLDNINSGKLKDLDGFPLEKVRIIDKDVAAIEDIENNEKWQLVARIRNRTIENKDFQNIDLSETNLRGADLSGANLSGADLSGANLSGADLSDANLSGADLSGADLREADLSGADLREADLSDAHLRGADLSGADVTQTIFGYNEGIDKETKEDLIRRGAVFSDAPGDISPILV